jgi:hypothetical protein
LLSEGEQTDVLSSISAFNILLSLPSFSPSSISEPSSSSLSPSIEHCEECRDEQPFPEPIDSVKSSIFAASEHWELLPFERSLGSSLLFSFFLTYLSK